jgi:hypothetical protein
MDPKAQIHTKYFENLATLSVRRVKLSKLAHPCSFVQNMNPSIKQGTRTWQWLKGVWFDRSRLGDGPPAICYFSLPFNHIVEGGTARGTTAQVYLQLHISLYTGT